MKRVLSIGMALAVIFGAVSCGGGDKNKDDGGGVDLVLKTPTLKEASLNEDAQTIVLSWSDSGDYYITSYEVKIDEIEDEIITTSRPSYSVKYDKLGANKTFTWQVRGVSSDGKVKSEWAQGQFTTPAPIDPGKYIGTWKLDPSEANPFEIRTSLGGRDINLTDLIPSYPGAELPDVDNFGLTIKAHSGSSNKVDIDLGPMAAFLPIGEEILTLTCKTDQTVMSTASFPETGSDAVVFPYTFETPYRIADMIPGLSDLLPGVSNATVSGVTLTLRTISINGYTDEDNDNKAYFNIGVSTKLEVESDLPDILLGALHTALGSVTINTSLICVKE